MVGRGGVSAEGLFLPRRLQPAPPHVLNSHVARLAFGLGCMDAGHWTWRQTVNHDWDLNKRKDLEQVVINKYMPHNTDKTNWILLGYYHIAQFDISKIILSPARYITLA
jgi:hypothetical protein